MAGSRQGRPSRNFPKIGFARFAGRLRASSTRPIDRRVKNAHLRRFPRPSSVNVRAKYASLLRTSGALHLGIFDSPGTGPVTGPCRMEA
jgi:Leu/Phe-tRNA-protein transferase